MKFFSFFERNEAPQDITTQKLIGSGKYQVFKGQIQGKKEECAAKVFPTTQIAEEAYQKELAILSKIKHKNIISLIPNAKTIDKQRNHILAMEYAPYGDFFDLVMSRELKDEILIRTYFHQIIEAVECLHSNGIAHLDLKLDNLLLGKNYVLKVTDFDLSHYINQSIKPFSRGTAGYRAPEVWNGTFNNSLAADVYSMGIILYVFLTGEFPFLERETNRGKELQCYNAFCEQNETFWKEKLSYLEINLQTGVKELLNGMLTKNPSIRFTIKEIKSSKWYKGPVATKSTLEKAMKLVVEQVRRKQ